MSDETAARLVNAMRAWEDYEAYPTSDARRFQLAQRIIEEACRRLTKPLVLVISDARREDGGWPTFGQMGWGFFLTVAVIDGKVRAAIDQLMVEKGRVLGVDGGMADSNRGVALLEVRPHLVERLKRRVRDSREAGKHQGKGEQWFGELIETWTGMWRDQSFVVLDALVDPRHGLLWDNVAPTGEWQAARWAWLTFNSPLRNPIGVDDGKVEMWELPDVDPFKERVQRPYARWIGRKWPESSDQTEHQYEQAEVDRALRILQRGRDEPLEIDPDSIPLSALVRPKDINIQQRVLHYLLLDPKGPHMKAARIADLLGFADPRDVRKAAKACQKAMK